MEEIATRAVIVVVCHEQDGLLAGGNRLFGDNCKIRRIVEGPVHCCRHDTYMPYR